MIWVEDEEKIDFYDLEVVRKLVDFQFVHIKDFLGKMVKFYTFGFLLPFLLSMSLSNLFLLNVCYTMCLFVQIFFFMFEIVRMWEIRLAYFCDFWNLVDIAQFIMFCWLYGRKIYTQFDTDSAKENLLQSILLFQSFFKVFYFLRIYEQFHFILMMAQCIFREVSPFLLFVLSIMAAFAKLNQLLHSGILNQEDSGSNSFFPMMF